MMLPYFVLHTPSRKSAATQFALVVPQLLLARQTRRVYILWGDCRGAIHCALGLSQQEPKHHGSQGAMNCGPTDGHPVSPRRMENQLYSPARPSGSVSLFVSNASLESSNPLFTSF